MSARLNRIQNWLELAQETNWSVAALAKRSGVSVRMLERHFLHKVGKPPKAWLVEQRQKRAIQLLRGGCSVKETAAQLAYRYTHHLTREFKAYWGFCPSTQMLLKQPNTNQRRILV
jgi:transcriptional regulator GlxA family with amidase domain